MGSAGKSYCADPPRDDARGGGGTGRIADGDAAVTTACRGRVLKCLDAVRVVGRGSGRGVDAIHCPVGVGRAYQLPALGVEGEVGDFSANRNVDPVVERLVGVVEAEAERYQAMRAVEEGDTWCARRSIRP